MTTPGGKRVVMLAAVAANRVIGNGPDIPWRIPGEQARFKQRTLGQVLVMGRTTYESIGRPLPGRTTIVLTRDAGWTADGVLVASSLEAALALADDLLGDRPGDVVVAGGGAVYEAALPVADEQVLSEVHLTPAGDAYYPEFPAEEWDEVSREAYDGYDDVRRVRRPRRRPVAPAGG